MCVIRLRGSWQACHVRVQVTHAAGNDARSNGLNISWRERVLLHFIIYDLRVDAEKRTMTLCTHTRHAINVWISSVTIVNTCVCVCAFKFNLLIYAHNSPLRTTTNVYGEISDYIRRRAFARDARRTFLERG